MSAATTAPPPRLRGLTARLDDLLGRPVSMRALALLRVLAGAVVLLHLRPFLTDAWDGRIYSDAFYEPYAAWYPELPGALYVGLLWLAVVAAVAMSLGLLTRVATATTFAIVTYNLFLSTTHFHNNRAYLVIVLGLLAVAPCGRELSLDAWLRRRRGRPPLDPTAPGWPLWLLRFECAAVYGASGLSKLVDPDWFGGTVTWQRVTRARADLEAWSVPDWAVSVLTDRGFHTGAAKFVVLTELFIAVGLWRRGTRYAAVWVAVVFHLAIQGSASVQVFSFLAIAVLVIWAVPSTRDRVLRVDLAAPRQRRLASAVRALDWLARFRVEAAPPGARLEVVDRDGTTITRRAGRGVRAEPPSADGVVRAAGAAPPCRPERAPRRRDEHAVRAGGSRPAARVWRAGLTLALILVLVFAAGAPPERCPTVSADELRRSSQAAVDWFVRNQEADGAWLYLYDADDNAIPSEYNEVRHAGVTMGLYQAAAAGLPGALRSADRGTEWALDRLVRRDDWAALGGEGRVTTGATALLAAGLDIRRAATGDTRYDEELRELGRFLLAQAEPSGAVLAEYDAARGAPVAGEYSKYYTGEAYWALARLHRTFPDEGWGEAADRIGAYLATSRDEVEDHWPPIPDHWAAYGMSETVEFPDRGRPAAHGRRAELRAPAGRAVRRPGPLARASATARGARSCGAATCRAAAGTA